MKINNFFYLITCIFFFGCSSNDPDIMNELELPKFSADDYGIFSINSSSNFTWDVGNYVSPSKFANGKELFQFGFSFLDTMFIETGEEITEITLSIFNNTSDVIIDSKIFTQVQFPLLLWDVNTNGVEYFGEFEYEINIKSASNFADLSGRGFSVSCEILNECCYSTNQNCQLIETNKGYWNSERFLNTPTNVPLFIGNCCM